MLKYINLLLKGIAMGAANVIPGVSGGTIALITGIFERLINAIKSFNLKALKLLFRGDWKGFAKHIDLWFLIAVFAGIAIAIITLARLLGYLFENYPIQVWAFFFGLILASVWFVSKQATKWNAFTIIFFVVGVAIAIGISLMEPQKESDSLIYLFISGMVAACSMILPGLSGSFVLLIMGNYQLVMIDAVNDLNIKILLPVVIGAGIGLLVFSYILSWVFKKYRNQTIALLAGFILGSLKILWPWKETISTYIDRHGVEMPLKQKNVLPGAYESISGEPAFLWQAILFALIGIGVIWATEYFAQGMGEKEKE